MEIHFYPVLKNQDIDLTPPCDGDVREIFDVDFVEEPDEYLHIDKAYIIFLKKSELAASNFDTSSLDERGVVLDTYANSCYSEESFFDRYPIGKYIYFAIHKHNGVYRIVGFKNYMGLGGLTFVDLHEKNNIFVVKYKLRVEDRIFLPMIERFLKKVSLDQVSINMMGFINCVDWEANPKVKNKVKQLSDFFVTNRDFTLMFNGIPKNFTGATGTNSDRGWIYYKSNTRSYNHHARNKYISQFQKFIKLDNTNDDDMVFTTLPTVLDVKTFDQVMYKLLK